MNNERWMETYRSLIRLSIEAFKYLALINGGAVVALLAYLGNTVNEHSPQPDLRYSMGAFLLGLLFCGLVVLGSYLTQLKLLNEIGSDQKPKIPHYCILWITIALYMLSLAAFSFGAWQAMCAFTDCND